MAFVPAVITLAVTVARLLAERNHLPKWLANDAPGGMGAVIGIAWLPLLFGPLFALKIGPRLATTGARVKRLMSTLAVYGWMARVPVLALFFIDRHYGWNTHYAAMPPDAPPEFLKQALMVASAQLVFWPLIWTVGVGLLAGAFFLGRRPAAQLA
jgi:hypothetical protein